MILKFLNDNICVFILQTHKKVSKPSLPGGAPLTPLDETVPAAVNPPSYRTTHAVSKKISYVLVSVVVMNLCCMNDGRHVLSGLNCLSNSQLLWFLSHNV